MFRELLTAEFQPYGNLSSSQLDQLESHYDLMIRWNQRMNLIRFSKLEDLVRLHYCESLFLGTLLPSESLAIADLGSGAGFPGIPLSVLRPDCRVDLIESDQRKGVFLRESTRSISNVRVVSDRAESRPANSYDWTVSRAVSSKFVVQHPLASRVSLLTTGSEVPSAKKVHWSDAVKLPWGSDRIILTGTFHVEH